MHARLLAMGLLLATGCTPGAEAVRNRAEHDLQCPPRQITVARMSVSAGEPLLGNPDDALYEAKGCGKRAEYWIKGRKIRPHHGEWYAPR
jgi:hypothetical protein